MRKETIVIPWDRKQSKPSLPPPPPAFGLGQVTRPTHMHPSSPGDAGAQMYACRHRYKLLGVHWWETFLCSSPKSAFFFFLPLQCDLGATVFSLNYTQFLSSIIFYVLSLSDFILHSGIFLECSPGSTNNQRSQIKTVGTAVTCYSAGKIMIPQLLKCGNFPEPASFQGRGILPH